MRPFPPLSQLVLKVASRCNLNCSYCYVYNKRDSTWKSRPAVMSDDVFHAAIARARAYCERSGQESINVTFHGGEPCLAGASRFDRWCRHAKTQLGHLNLRIAMQTNGTLVDPEWVRVFREHDVGVGVSIDGAKEDHDRYRVDHAGNGSFDRVVAGLRLLQEAGLEHGVLCVIPLGADPIRTHRTLVDLQCKSVTYIMPDFTHDTIGEVHNRYGATPCADFLIPIFECWWNECTLDVQILDLLNIARIVMGGSSRIETLGNRPPGYVFVETDGEVEGLDNLRVCEDGMSSTGLNVMSSGFEEIREADRFHTAAMFHGLPLPDGCHGCIEQDTCAGGHLPHRYSRVTQFNNRSIWCADLLKLFAHVRNRLGVSAGETRRRREELLAIRRNAQPAHETRCDNTQAGP